MRVTRVRMHTQHGGMCEYLTVPAELLFRSERLSLDELALVEPLSIGAHAVRRAGLAAGECVLVVGAGPIGLATAQFALLAGARVIVMDVNERRLEFCGRQLGITEFVKAGEGTAGELAELTGGDMPTAVFDCTGNKASMERAFEYVAHGGRLVFVGLVQADVALNDPLFHRREMTLLATRNATGEDFERVIGALESGAVDVGPWMTHRCALDDFAGAFATWVEPASGVIKGIVEV